MQARKMFVGSGLVLAILSGAGLIASLPAAAQTSPSAAPATKTDDDAAEFAKLDANKDGQLDAAELQKWTAQPPDLEFMVRLGSIAQNPGRFQGALSKLGLGLPGR